MMTLKFNRSLGSGKDVVQVLGRFSSLMSVQRKRNRMRK